MTAFQGQNPETLLSRVAQEELYQHLCNVVQGTFGSEYQVDWVAPLNPDDVDTLNAGMIVHIDPVTGQFNVGLPAGYLPFLAKPAGGYNGVPAMGNAYGDGILALPVTVGQRVQTTEYEADAYLPNHPLTAYPPGHASVGVINRGLYYDDTIVGVVLAGPRTIAQNRTVLEFATYFLPPLESGSAVA